jgi:hypothetical protein
MAMKRLYGVRREQEQRQDELLRDVRTPFQRLWDCLLSREGNAVFAGGGACVAMLLYPPLWMVLFPLYVLLFLVKRARTRRDHLDMRMPACHPGIDYGGELPAKGRYGKAEGMFYIGNADDGRELWIIGFALAILEIF